MKGVKQVNGTYYGELDGLTYPIQDDQAEAFYKRWTGLSTATLVQDVLRDNAFWGEDLHALPGFQQTVTDLLNNILHHGMRDTIESVYSKKEVNV
jgi:tagaturonate reductase